jgi:WD40 repeat protein
MRAATASSDPLEATLLLAELHGLPEPAAWRLAVKEIAEKCVPVAVFKLPAGVEALSYSPDGRRIAAATWSSVAVIDAATGQIVANRSFKDVVVLASGARTGVLLTKDSLVVTTSGVVLRWPSTGPSALRPTVDTVPVTDVVAVLYASARNEILFVAKHRGVVYDAESFAFRRWIRVLNNVESVIEAADVSPDVAYLAVGTVDGLITWHDELQPTIGEKSRESVFAVSLSRQGRVAYATPTITAVREVDSGKLVEPFGGRSISGSIALSPDGGSLGWGNEDGTVWIASSVSSPVPFRGHTDRITRILFSPDGSTFATASSDGSVRIWPTKFRAPEFSETWGELPAAMRKRTTACLSPVQRAQLLGENQADAQNHYRACTVANGRGSGE